MLKEFSIQNVENNVRIDLDQTGKTGFVFKNSDIDWGSAKARHNTYSFPGQVGSYISSTNIKERSITVAAYIVYTPTKQDLAQNNREELVQLIESKISEKKTLLSRAINPLQTVKIALRGYFIEGKPESSVKFGKTEKDNNEYFCKFIFSLYCNNPLFHKDTMVQTVLSGSAEGWHFPLILKPTGFIFGRRYSYRLIEIVNDGDIPVGGVITIKAVGTVKNVKINNVYTGEFLVVKKTLKEGEKIVINTVNGSERSIKGYIENKEMNYFQYWGFEGSWLQFNVGSALIGYSVEEGDEQNVEISVELNPERYNLEV